MKSDNKFSYSQELAKYLQTKASWVVNWGMLTILCCWLLATLFIMRFQFEEKIPVKIIPQVSKASASLINNNPGRANGSQSLVKLILNSKDFSQLKLNNCLKLIYSQSDITINAIIDTTIINNQVVITAIVSSKKELRQEVKYKHTDTLACVCTWKQTLGGLIRNGILSRKDRLGL